MIYLDNNGTTFLDPKVFEAMEPILKGEMGNPSSIHRYGQKSRASLAKATKEVAAFFGVQTHEVVFTSGATEALNMVIRSLPKGAHIITSSLEHPAVMEPLKFTGCEVSYLDPYPGKGAITLSQIEEALCSSTRAIVVMAANNETGVKTDLEPIAAFAQNKGLVLIVDGVAVLGKEKWPIPKGVSAACFSGHKIHGPTGIGVAIIRRSMKVHPLIFGGPQQHGMRGGTENLPGIVGFAKALTLFNESEKDVAALRDYLEEGLLARLSGVVINGRGEPRLCNTCNCAFEGVEGDALLMQLDLAGVAVSLGSACSSGSIEPSRVLLNMGINSQIARNSIRISLSRFTTREEIERALQIIVQVVTHLRTVIL